MSATELVDFGHACVVVDTGVARVLLDPGVFSEGRQTLDYLRAVAPPVEVPIHEAVLSNPDLHYGLFDSLSPEGTDVRVLGRGVSTPLQ